MSRRPRRIGRLLLGAAALAGAALAAVAWGDRRAARALLPDGAVLALEARGAGKIVERLEDTRFAAALVAGPTYAWLERSATMQAIDGLRAAIGRATGITPRRRHLLDLAGSDAAAAWYPAANVAAAPTAAPWIAAGRLSLRAWPLAAAGRIALRLGLGGAVPREEIAGLTVHTIGSGGEAVHVFGVGRLLVASNDRELVRRAARLAAGEGQPLAAGEAWQRCFAPLPARGDLRLWAHGDAIPPWVRIPSRPTPRAAGAVLSAGAPLTVDVFLHAPDPATTRAEGAAAPPALALAGPAPLFFHSAAGPVPRHLAALIDGRAAAVARRGGPPGSPPALGRGFALAVTSVEEGGLFPRPQGIVAVGMRDAAAARQALPLLFPPGARSAAGRWGAALSTRESLPLAGEFELWGAAAGDRLIFATQLALIEALAPGAPTGGDDGPEVAAPGEGALDSVTTANVTKLLPPLRRYAPPLAGLLRARHRGAPDVSRDLDLLAAIRAIAVTSGSSPAGISSRFTFEVGDLPASR